MRRARVPSPTVPMTSRGSTKPCPASRSRHSRMGCGPPLRPSVRSRVREVNLLDRYPRAKRDIASREAAVPSQRDVARRFGKEYFDGDRGQGYGGYRYDGRWIPIAERMRDFYGLRAGHRILDVGCAKGFLLHDFRQVVPGVRVVGVDIS